MSPFLHLVILLVSEGIRERLYLSVVLIVLSNEAAYGKIICHMNIPNEHSIPKPPRMVPAIAAGFNTVANRISLILIPVILDLLLWFAPKLSIKNLVLPLIDESILAIAKFGNTDTATALSASQKLWKELLSQFSMLSTVRTIPVGVPSLIARTNYLDNPLGTPMMFQIQTGTMAFLIFVGLILVGFFAGSIYFDMLSRSTATGKESFSLKRLISQYFQSVSIAFYLILIALFLIVPLVFFLSLFSVFGGSVAQILFLLAGLGLLWLLIPLAFSVHGIYVMHQKAMPSMLLSAKMIRFFLPGTGTFILICALISEGLNLLWITTPSNSWLTLIGIMGHAFVVTALLAASFIYYREGLRWMQESLQKISAAANKQPESGGFLGRN